jgi:hypothetical protein
MSKAHALKTRDASPTDRQWQAPALKVLPLRPEQSASSLRQPAKPLSVDTAAPQPPPSAPPIMAKTANGKDKPKYNFN